MPSLDITKKGVGLGVLAIVLLALASSGSGWYSSYMSARAVPALRPVVTAAGHDFVLYQEQDNTISWDTNPRDEDLYSGQSISLCPANVARLTRECISLRHFAANIGQTRVYVPKDVDEGSWNLVLTPWGGEDHQPIPAASMAAPVKVAARPVNAPFSLRGTLLKSEYRIGITNITTDPPGAFDSADLSQPVAVTLELEQAQEATVGPAVVEPEDGGWLKVINLSKYLSSRAVPPVNLSAMTVGDGNVLRKKEYNVFSWDVTQAQDGSEYDGLAVALCPPKQVVAGKECLMLRNYVPNSGQASIYVPPYVEPGEWSMVVTPWKVGVDRPLWNSAEARAITVEEGGQNSDEVHVFGTLVRGEAVKLENVTVQPLEKLTATGPVSVILHIEGGQEVNSSDLPVRVLPDGTEISILPIESGNDPVSSPATEHVLFVTDEGYGVGSDGFTGLEGADEVCQGEAVRKGLSGEYKAILSDSKTSARERLLISGPVKNLAGEVIASDAEGFWGGALLAQVRSKVVGVVTNVFTWTASNPDGTSYADNTPASYCDDWKTRSRTAVMAGNNIVADDRWLSARRINCRASFPLYCISQSVIVASPSPLVASPSPDVVLPSPGSSLTPLSSLSPSPLPELALSLEYTVFVTDEGYKVGENGFNGLGGADGVCQGEAARKGLSGEYMAILSDSSTDARDRLTAIFPVRNIDGDIVARSVSDLWGGKLENSVRKKVVGPATNSFSWTGTGADGRKFTDNSRGTFCSDWTVASATPVRGGNNVAVDSGWVDTRNVGCRGSFPLYCIGRKIAASDFPSLSPSPEVTIPSPSPMAIGVELSAEKAEAGSDLGFTLTGVGLSSVQCVKLSLNGKEVEFSGNVPLCR